MGDSFSWEAFHAEMPWLVECAMNRQIDSDSYALACDTSTLEHWIETQKRDVWFAEEKLNAARWELKLMEDELKRRKSDTFVWNGNGYRW